MRYVFTGAILVILFLVQASSLVHATSRQAYGDFQFQFDQYRNKLAAFQTAYSTYKQYGSLASQQEALVKVQELIPQRNLATKTYFEFLNEKLIENPGLTSSQRGQYQMRIANHIKALDQNSAQVGSIATFADAKALSDWYDGSYKFIQADFRQSIITIQLGYLSYFAAKLTEAASRAQSLAEASRGIVTPEKQVILDRWLLALTNQYDLYQQAENAIEGAIPKLVGDQQSQDRDFTEIQTRIAQARQYLIDGVSYLGEIEEALKYE